MLRSKTSREGLWSYLLGQEGAKSLQRAEPCAWSHCSEQDWEISAHIQSALCPQPDLVERLISVDIGPTSTALISEFPAYISAMKSVNIPAGLSRSTARQLADSQLSSTVQVGNPSPRKGLLLLTCSWDSAFLPAQC